MSLQECTACKRTRVIVSKGLCDPCYRRLRKRGTTDYVARVRRECSIEGCTKLHVANGLCNMHRQRLKMTGTTELNPLDWGEKSDHPLYEAWDYLKERHGSWLSTEWLDFKRFAADMSPRPSDRHVIYRLDVTVPYTKDNCFWRAPRGKSLKGLQGKAYAAAWQREHRKTNPEYHKAAYLRKKFGITFDDFNDMMAKQGGVCAVCEKPETAVHVIKGVSKVRSLAVDHCHASNGVRGLLCTNCNRLLGNAKDDTELLRRAIVYLESHAA